MDPKFKFFTLAKLLNETYYDLLIEFPARFRGSLHSISLISLRCESPQLGLQDLSYSALQNHSQELIESLLVQLEIKIADGPWRCTPEKRLQSLIISKAILSKNIFSFLPDTKFITDEFAFGGSADFPRKKTVIDILGFNNATNAFVLIELKTERAKAELEGQLCRAEEIVRGNIPFYVNLLVRHGFVWQEPYKVEKVAIWPYVDSDKKQNLGNGIIEVGYVKKGGCNIEFISK